MDTTKTDDKTLVQALKLRKSDTEVDKAYSALYTKYYTFMINSFSKKTRNIEDAEDIVSEAFEKLINKVHMYNEHSAAFSTWFYTIVQNVFIDKLRKRRERELKSVTPFYDEDGNILDFEGTSQTMDPEQRLIREERNSTLRMLIEATLADKPRLLQITKLRFFNQLSYKEISDETGETIANIKTSLHRVKYILREACEQANIHL